jgi:hypothetical protein
MKNEQINFGNAILMLLQREFIRECKIEPATDENGKPKTDENGVQIERAIHPMNFNFELWMKHHKIIVEKSPIIQKPFNIVK